MLREHLAPALSSAKIKPDDLVPDLAALAARSQDELVRINARCALREIGAEVALK